MSSPAEPAVPRSGLGLAVADPEDIRTRVVAAWDAFLSLARAADLDRPSRLPGWTGAQLCVHLGRWDDSRPLDRLLHSVRAGGVGQIPHVDDENRRLVERYGDLPPAEILAALERSRAEIDEYFRSPVARELGHRPAMSALGPLPLSGVLNAGCYELAVHGLDLAPCGAPRPSDGLLDSGLAALIDVTGALAARHDVHLAVTAQTPGGGWRFTADESGWVTEPVPAGEVEGTAVLATVTDLLDASAGRISVPPLLLTRRIRIQAMSSFVRLAPLVEEVPGLPGGAALRTVSAGLGGSIAGVNKLFGRLPGRRR
ncbi:MAG: maleylpyruvate isomerase N-terminal domain-containing protein [Actinomycetota bacterium]|nr:maleylpyruvate isomerase N-terminal domain-containing protein [Actinomycetota bacterium]